MSENHFVGDLEINEDLEFQKRSWTVQRIGWIIMGLLIASGLFGVFGNGIAANATVGEENSPLQIEYNRFARSQSPTTIIMRLGAGVDRIRISREYLETVQIVSVTPQPEAVEVAKDSYLYIFRRAANDGEPITATFHLRTQNMGLISAQAGVDGGITGEFWQFIYP